VVVEGIFVLYYPELADLLDLKVFIDAKEYIKLKRRIVRDKVERGYDLDDVLYRYEMHVMPTYEKYIEPFKNDADLIIPNNRNFDHALDVIRSYLRMKTK
jgi:uridine kinase